MILGLAIYGAIALGCAVLLAAVVVVRLLRSLRLDPYEPAAAEAPADPVDEHFTTAPRESEAELDRLVAAFNWERYETWLKEPS